MDLIAGRSRQEYNQRKKLWRQILMSDLIAVPEVKYILNFNEAPRSKLQGIRAKANKRIKAIK